eukprot:Hpha_TRINITY_DN30568_c0_g1::TRINITY_DN30568_c0_g1_i1::g.193572::m.193572/K08994/yneE; putative membrane protein
MTVRYDTGSFWRVIFMRWCSGSVLPAVLPHMIVAALLGLAACVIENYYWADNDLMSDHAHKILVVPLSFLLIFRSNISYSRFWEGRVNLTVMVRGCTELMRQACAYIDSDAEKATADRWALRAISLTMLRIISMEVSAVPTDDEEGRAALAERCKELGEAGMDVQSLSRPEVFDVRSLIPVLATRASMVLASSRADGYITSSRQMMEMDRQIHDITAAWLSCRKIKDTPMPFPYVQMLNFFLIVFVYTLPFAIAHTFSWGTPAIGAVAALALFGINAIGVEIEDPFGDDPNDFELEDAIAEVAADTRSLLKCRERQQMGSDGEMDTDESSLPQSEGGVDESQQRVASERRRSSTTVSVTSPGKTRRRSSDVGDSRKPLLRPRRGSRKLS